MSDETIAPSGSIWGYLQLSLTVFVVCTMVFMIIMRANGTYHSKPYEERMKLKAQDQEQT